MPKSGKKAVLFDMWGTLLYEKPLFSTNGPNSYFGAACAELNVSFDAFKSARDQTVPEAMTGKLDGVARAARIMQLLELPPNIELAQKLSDLEDNMRLAAIQLYPNTTATLSEVRKRGYRTALVSNCTTVFPPIVKHLQLSASLDKLILSCEFGAAKPNPLIFEAACDALEVKPKECFYIGDGADDEMSASRALGMTSILIVQPGSHSSLHSVQGQHFEIKDISELLDFI